MLASSRLEPKKFFVFVAAAFLVFTMVYASIVVTHHYVCSRKPLEPGSCLPKGMCLAATDAVVPCDDVNPDGSLKGKTIGPYVR